MSLIADLAFLTRLNLPGDTNDQDIHQISKFSNMANLKTLDLSSANITDACLEDIRQFSSLEEIDVWDTSLSNSAILELSALPRINRLHFFHELDADDLAKFVADGRVECNELRLHGIEAKEIIGLACAVSSTPQLGTIRLWIADSNVDRTWCEPIRRLKADKISFLNCQFAPGFLSEYAFECMEINVSRRSAPEMLGNIQIAKSFRMEAHRGRTLSIDLEQPNRLPLMLSVFGDADDLLGSVSLDLRISRHLHSTTWEYLDKLPPGIVRSVTHLELDDSDDSWDEKSRNGEILSKLVKELDYPKFEEISIRDSQFCDDDFQIFERMVNLRHLRISTPNVCGTGFSHLRNLEHLTTVTIEDDCSMLYSLDPSEFCVMLKPMRRLRLIQLAERNYPRGADPTFELIEKKFPSIEVKGI